MGVAVGERVNEAGRVLSAANANALVSAWRALGTILSRALGAVPDDDAAESVREALSHGDVSRALELALRGVHPIAGDGYWLWVQDVFDATVVYRYETPAGATLYQRAYTITDAGAVTLGEPREVTQRTEYVPVTPASEAAALRSDLVPLAEAAASPVTVTRTRSPRMSSSTAAPMITRPSPVLSAPRSPRTWAVMPMDVAERHAPMKRLNTQWVPLGSRS